MITELTPTQSITDRLLSCFPSGSYCLPALLRLLRIVESTECTTACVECNTCPRMLINPQFVELHAATPEKLMMLVMHELHHVILGHTRLYKRVTPLDNLVFDAVINAMLCHLFPWAEYTSMFTDYYPEDQFPQCFLRPADGWIPDHLPPVPAALRVGPYAQLASLHQALYSQTGVTYQELRTALSQAISPDDLDLNLLLGDHRDEEEDDASSAGGLEHRSPVLLQEIRRIVERWPQPKNPITGRSLSELLQGVQVKVSAPSNRSLLIRLLRKVGGDAAGSTHRQRRVEHTEILSACPSPERRAVVINAMGGRTLLYRRSLPTPRVIPAGERIHVYLDVSGSIGDLVGPLYAAVLACRQWVHPTVHLFSTKVVDVSLSELRRGVRSTTGGTDISCVGEDIRRRKVRRAVIITDGYVGTPGAIDLKTLGAIRLGVALTPGITTRTDFDDVADFWCTLNTKETQS